MTVIVATNLHYKIFLKLHIMKRLFFHIANIKFETKINW